jgi:hypothetical protein
LSQRTWLPGRFADARVDRRAVYPASKSELKSLEEEGMKKIGFLSLLIMASLLLTLVFPVAAAGPKTPSAPTAPVAAAAPQALIAAAMPERHPHIDEALESMRSAKHHLESAEHDFQGHRSKAIEHLDRAIHEAEICLSMR